jgi:hypothetical protein
MSIHNQPQKKQETHNQARARAVTFRAASPVLLMQLWSHSADAAVPATQGRLRKCRGGQGCDKGITLSHSARKPIVSSSQRTLFARNPARILRCPHALLIGGYVLSCGRPGPDRGISAINNQTSRRKMFTFIGAIWPRRF